MESSRNNKGRFVTGHKGAKPKGAINKSTRDYLVRLEKINNLLEVNLEENINSLKGKAYAMFWLEVQKMIHIKLAKFSEPDSAKERINNITIQLVGADGKAIDDPPVSLVTPAACATVAQQPAQVPPANSTSEQYGAIDVGRVRRPGYLRRTNSI